MKIVLTVLLAVISFVALASNDFSNDYSERVVHFHSDIVIKKNREVYVTETIVVNAQGAQIQRGIFREIPLTYNSSFKTYRVAFDLLGIKKNGKTEPYHTEWRENGIAVYIGDENIYLNPGRYTYEIKYKLEYVIGMFDDLDELYWNVNGNGWQLSFDSISAVIHLPPGATPKQYRCYTGRYGYMESNCDAIENGNQITFYATNGLYSEEGLTVVVGWDKGFIDKPTTSEKIVEHLWHNMLVYLGILTVTIGFLFNFIMWFKYGRDPKPGTIIPRFYPPQNMSPAECAYLDNEGRRTKTMVSSAILGIAVKGWIDIERKQSGHYIIRKSKRDAKELCPGAETDFGKRMTVKDTLTIKKGSYNLVLSKFCQRLEEDIDKSQSGIYFLRNNRLKWIQFIFPAITLIVGLIAQNIYGGTIFIPIAITILHLAMNFIFARLYEQPTPKGRKILDEIAGFKMYLKHADADRIRTMNPPTMDFKHFEENLAYAVALGLANEWGSHFGDQITQEMQDNMPYITGVHMYNYAFLSTLGTEMSGAISSAATPPSTSGSGGGFSGGGGGFSGGGFGGGGGGGW